MKDWLSEAYSRVMRKTRRVGECLEYQGYIHRKKNGYGKIMVDGKYEYVHRIVYMHHNGAIPEGHEILHSCDNSICVEPTHVRAGTHAENMTEMMERNRFVASKGRAIFNQKDADFIRFVRNECWMSAAEIAKMTGVRTMVIKKIATNKTYC